MRALVKTRPEPVTVPDEYRKWLEAYAEEIAVKCIEKLSEFDIETTSTSNTPDHYYSKPFNEFLISQVIYSFIPSSYYIRDRAMEEYNTKVSALANEKQNAIDDILIRLELGEVKKNELDEILAKFK